MLNGKTDRRMRMKSISLEDLGSIVKRMISGAIDDTEQMEKLHRAIYEELYLEKITDIVKVESIEHIAKFGEEEKLPSKDSTMIFSQRAIITDSCNNRSDDRDINKINNESVSKIRNFKENKTDQRNETKLQSKRDLDDVTERNERAFEEWKREKTKSIKKLLKEERKKKLLELETRAADIEKKRASHKAYLRSKKLKKLKPQFAETPTTANANAGLTIRDDEYERIIVNEKAFEAWKRRKNNQSQRHCCQPSKRMEIKMSGHCNEVEFDSWLDRLDSVLHQKYLRERRYLVRSFYCQPAYYGTAALSIQ